MHKPKMLNIIETENFDEISFSQAKMQVHGLATLNNISIINRNWSQEMIFEIPFIYTYFNLVSDGKSIN